MCNKLYTFSNMESVETLPIIIDNVDAEIVLNRKS